MDGKVNKQKIPSVLGACSTLLGVCFMILVGLRLGIGAPMSLFLGTVVAIMAALFYQVPWQTIQTRFMRVISDSLVPILILMIVGIMVGAWLIGGTVPSLMYYGLKFCNPASILPLTFILCIIMSVFSGTSFGSIATMGLALTGVGMSMGIPAYMVAGAAVSGAWFGDKLSPMSDSTNIASAMTGANLFEHIGSMLYTTIPASLICVVLYAMLGLRYTGGIMDMSNVDLMLETLDATFHIGIIAVIPAILMLVVSAKKVPAILGLGGCALFSIVFAMILQPVDFQQVMTACFSGYHSETGVVMVDTILSRGGLTSMTSTVFIIILAAVMGGTLMASGVIDVFVEKILVKMIRSSRSLVISTMIYSYMILFMSGNQQLGVLMGGATFKDIYKKMDVHKKVLSRALADTSDIFAPAVPWSSACLYVMGVLGVSSAYIPFSFLCFIVPMFTVFYACTGFAMWKDDGTPFRRRKQGTMDKDLQAEACSIKEETR